MLKRTYRFFPVVGVIIGLLFSGVLPANLVQAHGPGSGPTLRLAQVETPKVPTGPLQSVELPQPNLGPRIQGEEYGKPVDMKLLVLSADGKEAGLPAIQSTLDYLGAAYNVVILKQRPGWLTRANLTDELKGFYQGVILATGTLVYNADPAGWSPQPTVSNAEWQVLWSYERDFGARQVTWYTEPTLDFGYGTPNPLWGSDPGPAGLSASLTSTGFNKVFKYLSQSAKVNIAYAWTYQAKTVLSDTVPVLVDGSGNALASIRTYPDGRENLALTFDSNPNQNHMVMLNYGIVNWVTKGIFLGERHIYLAAQNDDLFIPDELWDPKTLTTTASTYRMNGDDVRALVNWQTAINQRPTTGQVKMQYAFNAVGTTADYETDKSTLPTPGSQPLATPLKLYSKPKDDKASVTTAIRQSQTDLMFINHTWDHTNLDATSYDETYGELMRNINQASLMGLSYFSPKNLVTPDVSGLRNSEALKAMIAAGVKNMVSDTSRPGENNPAPNVGIPNWSFPDSLYMIPRYPTNLFYNVGTPTEWASEYNFLYRAYWGRNLTYSEILDKEADVVLGYMLRGNINPIMLHQTNTRFYDKTHSTQTDLLDRIFQKYDAVFNLPILSLQMDEIGQRMRDKGQYLSAGVRATWDPASKKVTLKATKAAVVPVTGLQTGTLAEELYGAQYISHVSVPAGATVELVATNRGAPIQSAEIAPAAMHASQMDTPVVGESYEYVGNVEAIKFTVDPSYEPAEGRAYFEVNIPAAGVRTR